MYEFLSNFWDWMHIKWMYASHMDCCASSEFDKESFKKYVDEFISLEVQKKTCRSENMEDPISKFLKESEEFKKTKKYQSMPSHLRDFFNEEIGRFSAIHEMAILIEKQDTQ